MSVPSPPYSSGKVSETTKNVSPSLIFKTDLVSPALFISPKVSVPFVLGVMVNTVLPLVSLITIAFLTKVNLFNSKRSILALYSATSLISQSSCGLLEVPLAPPSIISFPVPPINRSPPLPATITSFPASPDIKSLSGVSLADFSLSVIFTLLKLISSSPNVPCQLTSPAQP